MSLSFPSYSSAGSWLGAVGSSFAYDLTRRISAQGKGLDAASATDDDAAAALAEKQSQLSSLESALAGTVSFMREKHGDRAASTMIGLVYKRLGDGDINEQTLGNTFLDVTRFIDKHFGIDAGNAFMDHLNGSLNEDMNAFFDNGLNEIFMAVTDGASGSGGGFDASGLLGDISMEYTNAIKQMIEEARATPEDNGLPGAYGSAHSETMLGVMKDVMV